MAERIPVPHPRPRDYKRFMDKVSIRSNGCWEWTGGKFMQGYGMFWLQGKQRRAHRVLYVWTYGEVGDGDDLDHLCRNRACVNPDHLEIATRRENVLRGSGPTAVNAAKSYCAHGHEFTPENTYIDPKTGYRQCRICKREGIYKWREENREVYLAKRREKREHVVHEPRVCIECGASFTPIRSTKRFCSERCQATANNRKQRQRRRMTDLRSRL